MKILLQAIAYLLATKRNKKKETLNDQKHMPTIEEKMEEMEEEYEILIHELLDNYNPLEEG